MFSVDYSRTSCLFSILATVETFLYMFSVDYSRTSCLFSVLATVETFYICSVLITVETSCLCSDLSTVEPFVYFQFNYSRSHIFMCSVNYSINSYLFLVLTTVEPLVYAQFYQQQNLFFLFIIILEPLFLIHLAKRLAFVNFSHCNLLL